MTDHSKVKFLKEYNEAIMPRLLEICEPLKIFNISNFAYAKFSQDQKFFRVGTHEKYTELFFNHNLYDRMDAFRGFINSDSFSKEKKEMIFIWKPEGSSEKLRISVDMWNGITIYQIKKDCIEGCAFGGTLKDTGLINFYLNNLDLLKKFFTYFKSIATDIIDISDRNKTIDIIFQNDSQNPYKADSAKVFEFNSKLYAKKFFLTTGENKFSLSLREIECLSYKNQGFTAKQIARKCKLSPRTVESYLHNAKIRSGYLNISQLIYHCKEEGLL